MDVLMPQLGETVAEGKISVWFKKVGDEVAPGDNLFEIETDKTSMEVPATSGGVLAEIRVAQGEIVPVGAVVAVIGDSAGAAASAPAAAPKPAAAPAPKPAPAAAAPAAAPAVSYAQPAMASRPIALDPFREVRTPERNWGPARMGGIAVTPLARRIAGERGIDLSGIQGTGPHGRILARDVESARPSPRAGIAAPAGPSSAEIMALYRDVPHEEVPARRHAQDHRVAAHRCQADGAAFLSHLRYRHRQPLKARQEINAAAPSNGKEPAYRISVNDFVIKALALALRRVPAANAIWAEDRILRFQRSDIGVAVAIEGGLLTPVVRNADGRSLGAISNEMRELAARAREKKLKPHEYQGGSSAISNLGMYGVREFAAIINPPQSTILAVGAARRVPVENEDGTLRFTDQMTVTLSCDHRVVDGALGAQLLAAVKGFLEQPVTLLA